jgi:hypothetical protein
VQLRKEDEEGSNERVGSQRSGWSESIVFTLRRATGKEISGKVGNIKPPTPTAQTTLISFERPKNGKEASFSPSVLRR